VPPQSPDPPSVLVPNSYCASVNITTNVTMMDMITKATDAAARAALAAAANSSAGAGGLAAQLGPLSALKVRGCGSMLCPAGQAQRPCAAA
jgi:hypothetical protein